MVLKSLGRHLIFLGVLCLGISSQVQAATKVADLYKVSEVIAVGASTRERHQLMAQGLAKVFAKVSGDEAVLADDDINKYLQDAQSYLLSFSFEANNEKRVNALGEVVDTQRLKMSFDPSRVNASLTTLGFPVWSARRPDIMVWVASNNHGVREILSSDSSLNMADKVQQLADARGLPVMLPHGDLEDQLTLDVSELWGLFAEPLAAASARYNADAILAGRVESVNDQQWRSTWLFIFNGEQQKYTVNGRSEEDIIDQVLGQISSRLSGQYAVYLNSLFQDRVVLRISGVQNLKRYHSVLQYVENMTGVSSPLVVSVTDDILRIQVDVSGDVQQLKRLIALDSRLVPEQYFAAAGVQEPPNELRYVWNP
ncbi:DUF2066 domain-containing protein [Gynuella sp.]|uniref:DUF2066 domain-containing protein n=1 Tax=Gynuella sp. TaxID=2969146 RepID=UPI003D09D70B